MRRFLDRLYACFGGLAALCVLTLGLLMLGQSLLREVGAPSSGITDVVAWLCAASSFLAMAHAFKHGDFVRVTLLVDKLGARPRRMLDIAALAIGSVAIGYLAFWATRFAWESWEINDVASGLLPVPLWIPQTTFVAGAWLFFIAMVDELVIVARGERPTYVRAVEERHAHGDFSSDL